MAEPMGVNVGYVAPCEALPGVEDTQEQDVPDQDSAEPCEGRGAFPVTRMNSSTDSELQKQQEIPTDPLKIDADTSVPVPGTILTVEGIDSNYKNDWTTGADSTVALRVDPGTYRITEKFIPNPYYLLDRDANRVQTISLNLRR